MTLQPRTRLELVQVSNVAVNTSPGFHIAQDSKMFLLSAATKRAPVRDLSWSNAHLRCRQSEAQNRGYCLALHTDWIVVRLLRRIRLPAESLPPIDKPLSARLLCSCGSMTHKSAPPCRINLRILDVLSSQH